MSGPAERAGTERACERADGTERARERADGTERARERADGTERACEPANRTERADSPREPASEPSTPSGPDPMKGIRGGVRPAVLVLEAIVVLLALLVFARFGSQGRPRWASR